MTERIEMTRWECLDLAAGTPIGRLCIIDRGYPLAFPVNVRLEQHGDVTRFVVRTAPHTAIAAHATPPGPASIELDHIDLDAGTAWSVIARGQLRREVNPLDLPDPHPLVEQGRTTWLVLEVTSVSGRRFNVRRADGPFLVEWQMID